MLSFAASLCYSNVEGSIHNVSSSTVIKLSSSEPVVEFINECANDRVVLFVS